MLSDHELRRLNEIERELRLTDPSLDASLSTMGLRWRWALPLALLGWASFAALAAVGWWVIAILLVGPLIPATLAVLVDGLANGNRQPGPPQDPVG